MEKVMDKARRRRRTRKRGTRALQDALEAAAEADACSGGNGEAPIGPADREDQEQEATDLLETIKSLYDDLLEPLDRHVLRRVEERTGSRWSAKQLRAVAARTPTIRLVDAEADPSSFWLYHTEWPVDKFVDQKSMEDRYPAQLWNDLREFVAATDWGTGLARSRYECAVVLRSKMPQILAEYRLGEICHIVQLAVKVHHILGYRDGSLVPYYSSSDYEKYMNAECKRFLAECPVDQTAVTWAELPGYLAEILNETSGGNSAIGLSIMKDFFRHKYKRELSEAALGCTTLSAVFENESLAQICRLEMRGTERFVKRVNAPATPGPVEAAMP
eukprot:CAMPEP_0180704238 /NCGR_PEP_ID=MMETSP1038_2-20121128/7043_1 /TAXON_ID=632150 /ORGANISM="Azadinium spinosum, Strain 3D9" /LENGTH=330 /DNA_ID=CAMNT_0022736045 /DNA_START=1 /DNA_END=990 /DNA_ORIENTATION=+